MTTTADLLADIDAEIAVFEHRVRELELPAAQASATLQVLFRARDALSHIPAPVKRHRQNAADGIAAILRESGPLHYKEIARRLVQRGAPIKTNSVATAISLAEPGRFRRVSVGVYDLAQKN